MEKQVLNSLKDMFRNHFLIHVNYLKYNQYLDQDLGMNELEKLEMFCYMEEMFHVEFEDTELSKVRTVGDLVGVVSKHVN